MRSGYFASCLALASLGSAGAQTPVAPRIVTHPVPVNVAAGERFTLSATVTGTPPLYYLWYKDDVLIPGATDSSFTQIAGLPTGRTFATSFYTLLAINTAGTISSFPVAVFVSTVPTTPPAPSTLTPQTIAFAAPAANATAGSGVALSATASSGLPVTFSLVSGSASLSGNVVIGSGGPVVVRAAQAGNATFAAATPVERTVNFLAGTLAPFITSPPTDQTALAGTSLALRAIAIGTPLPTFQWEKDGAAIPGATNTTLPFPNLTLTDAGRYTLTATNLAGTASASAQIIVRAAPILTSLPASRTIVAPNAATFSVIATGFPVPTYQWRKNGTAIAGATGPTLSLASTTSADAGNYDVVVTNALGTATSPAATLTVVIRDFTGTYLGRFAPGTGDFAVRVRADGTAMFLGHLAAQSSGLVGLTVNVSLAGELSATLPLIAATARDVTLRGTIDEIAGTISGTIAELNARFEGTRIAPRDPALPQAGAYSAALVGSTSGRGYAIVAPDGQALLMTAGGTAPDFARGTLGATGRLTAISTSQAAVDIGFSSGALRGTVRLPNGSTGTLAGAIDTLAGTEHLMNLSVRCITTPEAPVIVGFAISGTTGKQVLVRAVGPTLGRAPFNVAGMLADPNLQLSRAGAAVGQNNDWGNPAANAAALTAATSRAGAFPLATGSTDAALLNTLNPAVYSMLIGGGTGIVLAEIYEVPVANELPGSRRLINTSTLGVVAPDFPLFAGFVIGGTGPQRLLIRAVGPTLAAAPFNVAGALANPQFTVFRGATVVRTSDDWFRDTEAAAIRDAAARVRAFALGAQSLDAAMLIFLEPGAYTAQVSGPANAPPAAATGRVLVEVYEIP